MLTRRKEQVLRAIVGEYVSMGIPVASESIARRYELGVSPATIRHEMVELEEEGYIRQPHTSAGRIPSDRGYRYYVEFLIEGEELPWEEQCTVRHQFHQVERELEEWARLAAAVLSHLVRNVAVVTLPKAVESRLRHVELILLQEFLALMIIVFQEAKLRRQIVTLSESVSAEGLSTIARRLSEAYAGLTGRQIVAKRFSLSNLEWQIVGAMVQALEAEEEQEYDEPYVAGLHHIPVQPEFGSAEDMAQLMGLLEAGRVESILPRRPSGGEVQVVIGGENRQQGMSNVSVVAADYGVRDQYSGVIGVVGPTRMPYPRAIGTVRFLSSVMSELASEVYG